MRRESETNLFWAIHILRILRSMSLDLTDLKALRDCYYQYGLLLYIALRAYLKGTLLIINLFLRTKGERENLTVCCCL